MSVEGVAVACGIYVGPGVEFPFETRFGQSELFAVHCRHLHGERFGELHESVAGFFAPFMEVVRGLPAAVVAALGAAAILRHAGRDDGFQLGIKFCGIGVLEAGEGCCEQPSNLYQVRIYQLAGRRHCGFSGLLKLQKTIPSELESRCKPL